MLEKIHIFHTNDLHSHFKYWPRMQSYVKEERNNLARIGETSYLFDVGDHLDRSNIYTEATIGKGNVQLLNEAEYDVVTIGNNEGITLSHNELFHLYDDANFDVVVGNIDAVNGRNPAWLKPYVVLTTEKGTKLGIIAATAMFDVYYEALNWQLVEARSTLLRLAHQLRKEVDIVLCLSHLGITEDELLAEECPEIDVIFGSHTHHVLPEGKLVNGVLLTGGGKFGQYTGHLVIEYDKKMRKIVEKKDTLIHNKDLPNIQNEQQIVQSLEDEGIRILDTPVFTTEKSYNKEWFHYSQLSDLFAHAILEKSGADCALFNAGIFLDGLPKGNVTALDVHRIFPHPINLCTIELSVTEIKEIYMQSKNEEWPYIELKGLGFRGVIFGKMLTYGFSMNDNRQLLINGKLADNNHIYKLVTLDLFTFGYFYPSFKYAKKQYILPEFLRNIMIDYGQSFFK
ncbi:bifunctional metallophosphatase/5'-nucleotidase [Lysinibacillus fusiformis]|uniref:bifunctional metallophosphatase/5'-nucleotidase n=1 Tax=Lysinibacillus fusiformis TaxID=28031 RepID=UPI000D366645|nr:MULTISPECIES: bifunctional UDP-sugar hydrolase/5'-nucleotidase [Lysinibacillus]MED4669059.1 bifunctional UDP-sugar hydrolase/5'-nucleotidase [Lysinibacillus fusiformis]NOG29071.1 bifunctional metallophosphatase/5'-nucleotidase [Lysinibacillus fusiformis]QAS57206.1 bifunctional metallophosphatase/5'-nucleotidase [Lysinibacillus sphaericus]RDV31808.1 bifunctional metallophosphatase/5'-nucleotidase [Lysinibacillus fusiformis]GED63360.1 putative metallophosphoesterase YunD [Lysinibacillus fusif